MIRRLLVVAALVAALVAATACTTDADTPAQSGESPQTTTGGSATKAVAKAPLTFDGSGQSCVANRYRDFVYADDILETSEPIELRSVSLAFSQGLRQVGAWVMPVEGAVPMSGMLSGWPIERRFRDGEGPGFAWDERQPVVGATLTPGTSYNLVVRIRRVGALFPGGFRGLRIAYTGEQADHETRTRTSVRFAKNCR